MLLITDALRITAVLLFRKSEEKRSSVKNSQVLYAEQKKRAKKG